MMLSLVLNEVNAPPPHLSHPQAQTANPDTTTTATTVQAPRFTTYLLPSLSRPFHRLRRFSSSFTTATVATFTTSATTATTAANTGNEAPADGDIPSPNASPQAPTETEDASIPSPDASGYSHVIDGSHRQRQTAAEPPDHTPRLARIQPDTIRCSTCGTDFAFHSQIVSKCFTGRHGRAYLVAPPDHPRQKSGRAVDLINVRVGKPENRILVTGSHTVCDIHCLICRARVGWKYLDAKEESQRYKIGKFILETQRTVNFRHWEDVTTDEWLGLELEQMNGYGDCGNDEPIVFDSEDEDECEDLFTGIWNPKIAAARRKLKAHQQK
ncbi:yippee zinc-binding/DNA-binding /Mis18, centromere assembly-domain-containing protein [Xylaria sp. CBS 124048]|nr:yippee zinc-binding/DNA-binding /Mis18, centromere assembly-domain-containing protein [Xylaria sp. CBS 124048]